MGRSRTFQASLRRLFPADDPDSPWLFRLAVLHDDLIFEIKGIETTEDLWTKGYFSRRLTITLAEITDIIKAERIANAPRATGLPDERLVPWRELRETALKAKPVVDELRHRIGGHVNPRNKVSGLPEPPKDIEASILRTHEEIAGLVTLGDAPGDTSYRNLTMYAMVIMPWGDVVDHESLVQVGPPRLETVVQLAGLVARGIEGVLMHFWHRRGGLPK